MSSRETRGSSAGSLGAVMRTSPSISEFLTQLQGELKRVHPKLAGSRRLEFKHYFGAAAGYVDGRIFVSCGEFGTALKLPPDPLARLWREPGVMPLKYFPNGHVKKEYAVIPRRIIEDRVRFRSLVGKSIRHAASRAR
jgi:hypothetical protein